LPGRRPARAARIRRRTPVWKTSYRLILDNAAATVAPATQPAGGASLQGWAIVENQTDNDWNNVQLSLVSGRPISFVEDLYQPLYVPAAGGHAGIVRELALRKCMPVEGTRQPRIRWL